MSPLALPPQSYLGWKVTIIILHTIAITSTIYRLVHRFRKHQAWWDDYIVFIPFVVDIGFWVLILARFPHPTQPGDVESFTDEVYASFWLTTFPCLVITWTTRAVLALSIARVFPRKHPARRWSFVLVGLMCLSCMASIAVTTATCKYTSGLLSQDDIQNCAKSLGGFPLKTLFLFVVDLLSDFLLAVSALVIYWRLTLPPNEQRLILTVLCGSSLVLLSALASMIITDTHATSMPFQDVVLLVVAFGNMEGALSLFVCNLAVISAGFGRGARRVLHLERRNPESFAESSQHSAESCSCCSSTPTPLTLTEISDLSIPSNSRSERSSRVSSQAAQDSSCHGDSEIAEKQRTPASDSENDLGLNKFS